MTSPKIAVLFPVYNPGPELTATLDSIRNQTVSSRLYLIDDGSKNKPDYQLLLKGMDARLIELPENVGITGAMNAGLAEILKGDYEYVARMDNGDVNALNRFEVQVDYLRKHPDIALVGSFLRLEYTATGIKFDWRGPVDQSQCLKKLRYNAPLVHPTIMFRMAFIRQFQAYDHNYPAAEDYAMEFWAANNGFAMSNIPLMLYRSVELRQSISGGSRKRQLLSRLRLQWENRNSLDIHTWIGLLRSLVSLVVPVKTVQKIKLALSAKPV